MRLEKPSLPKTLRLAGVPQTGRGVVGPLTGATGGRADKLPIHVPNGAHVLPADIVSALGAGNSQHGHAVLSHLFPGSRAPGKAARSAPMRATPRGFPSPFARGGAVPIMASDGEFIVSPDDVLKIGQGNLKQGHNILDRFIKEVRKKNIKKLKSLPGPSK